MRLPLVSICTVLAVALVPALGWSGTYELIVGDEIELHLPGEDEPQFLTVNLDGEIRVLGLGAVAVSGLDLDAAENLVETELAQSGLYANPTVTMDIATYAQITVVGDVSDPGRYDFFPGMTVATALALSGGQQEWGVSKIELERARIDLESQRVSTNAKLINLVIQEAVFQARVQNSSQIDPRFAQIPQVDTALVKTKLSQAKIAHDHELEFQRASLSLMDKQIGNLAEQRRVFGERLFIQNQILDTMKKGAERAEDLAKRGLQASTQTSLAIQRYADARAKILELEQAILSAERALTDLRKTRNSLVSERRMDALDQLAQTRLRIEQETLNYDRVVKNLYLVNGDEFSTALLTKGVEAEVSIQSPRDGVASTRVDDLMQRLMPGDTVVVRMSVSNYFDG